MMARPISKVINYPPRRAIILRNTTCAYCGGAFDGELAATKEHVIGRRFVPRGCFDSQWNLILNACEDCNRDKANLEDDISAISMLPDLTGRFAIDDPRLAAASPRKAFNARSRRTGKTVARSHEKLNIEGDFGSATFTFNFTAPPQIEESRVFRLAHYHFRGFFYLITFEEKTRRGGFMRGGFFPLLTAGRADWGNPRLRWFMDLVRAWDFRIHAIGADTFFKMIIRRHPQGQEVWAWALEWNHAIRVVGFAGDLEAVKALAAGMPDLPLHVVRDEPDKWMGVRTEVSLAECEDDLFMTRTEMDETPDAVPGTE